ncbi:MAG: hypothetical protein AAFY26_25795 [Cyanobacteria bacterium J06638_22]
MNRKASSFLSTQVILIITIAWAVFSLLFFLLFSVPLPGQGRPEWYSIFTYFLESFAFLAATVFCFRNWRSQQIVSGRGVWLLIGLGMLSYFFGNLILFWWEIVWRKEPDVSPADFFYLLMYILVGFGMMLAITSRKLNLNPFQWLAVFGVGVVGTIISFAIYTEFGTSTEVGFVGQVAIAQEIVQEAPVADPPADPVALPADSAPPVEANPAPENALPEEALPIEAVPETPTDVSPAPTDATTTPAEVPAAPADGAVDTDAEAATDSEEGNIPGWASTLNEKLEPFGEAIGIAYVVGDILLVMAASSLLIAFWGGRFSQSWRFIAAAAFSFYIADTWFLWATTYVENYQTGALPEVFWVFSACLFVMGAALEYDLSSRSRRGSRRRS